MLTEKELIKMLQEQMSLEKGNAQAVAQTAKKTRNAIVKQLLNGVAVDSEKHMYVLNAAIELLSGVTPAISEGERDRLNEELRKHLETENAILSRTEELIWKIRHKKVKFLLQYILYDEKRHNEILKEIMKHIVDKETITEDDWWDFLWKGSVAHGAPE
jgi:rubrerythrin